MFPIINLLSRVPPWTSINNPSQRLELLYTCFTLQENKSLKYIIKPPQSLHEFPAWIRRYPGRLKILVSCLSESHVSCKQIALIRITVFNMFSSRGVGVRGSHVMMVSTYVPIKMGPLLKLQYPFGWILKVFSIQKGQYTWTSIHW